METGGTAIHTKSPTPAIKRLFEQGHIAAGMNVVDYGAGHGRNANWLRERGVNVYAYDPYNGYGDLNGWDGVSYRHPSKRVDNQFDVLFTSYVLNVVDADTEMEILGDAETIAPIQYHVTRNKDILDMIKGALKRGDKTVTSHYTDVYGGDLTRSHVTCHLYMFAVHGTYTSRGYQRLPMVYHYDRIQYTHSYKVYRNDILHEV